MNWKLVLIVNVAFAYQAYATYWPVEDFLCEYWGSTRHYTEWGISDLHKTYDGHTALYYQSATIRGDVKYSTGNLRVKESYSTNGDHFGVPVQLGSFQGCSVTSLACNSNMTNMEACAFMNCRSLTNFIANANLKSISRAAFSNCTTTFPIELDYMRLWPHLAHPRRPPDLLAHPNETLGVTAA